MTTFIIAVAFVVFALPTVVVALGLVVWANDMVVEQMKLIETDTELYSEVRA